MQWNEQRQKVFLDRYALKDSEGVLLEQRIEEMWERVSRAFARNPEEHLEFRHALEDFRFVPSGRILSGAEAGQQVTYYNCYVIGVRSEDPLKGNDSRHGIMDTMTKMVEITSRGGGVGINWSTLRPEGAYIQGVHGNSSGANSWMRGADGLADQIRQGGSRTAALMFLLEDWHPDIINFVESGQRFNRANFSVGVSDRFMRALREDTNWTLIFPEIHGVPEYNQIWDGDIEAWIQKGLPVREYGTIRARELWDKMAQSAYDTGSPGVVFLDRCNELSNTRYREKIVCTNPCGEQPLPVGGCCNLGSMNLVAYYDGEGAFYGLNRPALAQGIETAIRFLDRVIDVNVDIDEEVGRMQRETRRIGLGTMGLADLLILNGIRYGSDDCLKVVDEIYTFIRDEAYKASIKLAVEFGPAPGYSHEFDEAPFIQSLPDALRHLITLHGIRNLSLLTQAPTGTTSILAGASSGIEPIFSRSYVRKDATGTHAMVHPLFASACGKHLVTALDISVTEHIAVQGAIQKRLDTSISKTINLRKDNNLTTVGLAMSMAYLYGCKGVTVYRNGSLDDVLCHDSGQDVQCQACQI